MARNEEKSRSMLNRWTTLKHDMLHGGLKRRHAPSPFDCSSLSEAEHWRRQIVTEFTRKLTEIQNSALGEHRIRELNDELNKLSKRKFAWERRIRELGGSNYTQSGSVLLSEGAALPGGGNYLYYGAAKNLPGVKELFDEASAPAAAPAVRRKRGHAALITPDYYGLRDEDDGELVPAEEIAETLAVAELETEWKRSELEKKKARAAMLAAAAASGATVVRQADEEDATITASAMKAHVAVPSQEDVQRALLERKKKELLSKYASSTLQAGLESSKKLLRK